MGKFILSTDSCVDLFKSYLEENNIYYIVLKRITDGAATEELYDSFEEYDKFYDSIRKGALPTTSQLSPYELREHFQRILDKEKEGDIIHLPLSSGLSNTCANAENAAAELNAGLTGRKIYVVDSLSATAGMGMLADMLLEMRNEGIKAQEAIARITEIRDNQQLWSIVGDLFHLKRGGRLSGFKATVGTLLKVKPIMIINAEGRLVIENTIKGTQKAVNYIISKMEKSREDFTSGKVYVTHSSDNELMAQLTERLKEKYPSIAIKVGMIGPIIGTHVGAGTVALIFTGAKRLTISAGH